MSKREAGNVLSLDGFIAARAMGLNRQRAQRVAAQVATTDNPDVAMGMLGAELVAAATEDREVGDAG